MKKDYHFYNRLAFIFGVIALCFVCVAMGPVLFHLNDESYRISTLQLIIALTGLGIYVVSAWFQKSGEILKFKEKQQKKKEAFNNIVDLVRNHSEHNEKTIIDALYDYDNKYN